MSWSRFLRRKRSDAELQDEIETFLAEETAENEARGMSPDEARRQARVKFGNPQKVRESLWTQNSPQPLARIVRDLKYAFRTLSRTPGFSIIAICGDGSLHRRGHIVFSRLCVRCCCGRFLSANPPGWSWCTNTSGGERTGFKLQPGFTSGLLRLALEDARF